jgi:spore coat protein YutH
MMKDLLLANYNIHATERIRVSGREGYRDNDYYYFIISSDNKEIIHLEQAALAYYLSEVGYNHTAIPIPAINNNWFIEKEKNNYIVLRVKSVQQDNRHSHGKRLAEFHNKSAAYNYEPKEISSYGTWKDLWIKKLTAFENKLEYEAKSFHNKYYRLLVDVFPYLIGLSENAIQYLQESETDKRFHQGDQGVFTFRRYKDHIMNPVIWTDELFYDHATRDLAEYLRYKFLQTELNMDEVTAFFNDYQEIRPLSIFSWRLLYARVAYPIHFFDFIEETFRGENFDWYHVELKRMVKKQGEYEKRLGQLFDMLNVDYERYDLPMFKWL